MKKSIAMYVRLSGTSRMNARKIMRAVQNVKIILVSLAIIFVLSSSAFAGYIYDGYEYSLTNNAYAPTANWAEAVASEFGPTAQVVDWNIITAEFGGSVDSLRSFLDGIGVMDVNNAPGVTCNGSQTWDGTRSYGINRAEGIVPSGYLIHDQIQNYWLLLGSWPADRQLVASVPVPTSSVPEPATVLLFGTGIAALAGTRLRRKKQ
ncbi:MAG TPA: PEP-CTERM sorting domain-containing protein [Smithellaceae bacterium]|nr:PEP-CTERM sorting domain-containing protein [Smithellaceae bacterium]